MSSMDQDDEVFIVSSATEMTAAIRGCEVVHGKGKEVEHGQDVSMEG